MILLDTNVLIYAFDTDSPHCELARQTIVDAVYGDGAAINAVTLAEICVGDLEPGSVADPIRRWGVQVLDVPAALADTCAVAYRAYRKRRTSQSGQPAPAMPPPDFFIGSHAAIMSWSLATVDTDRFRTYFPTVRLIAP
jgi:predicted nucleic acid-binding protein